MRVKQTAKKITNENCNEIITNDNSLDIENSEHNSCDNPNDISDNEVEFLVECRRDQEGNQVLLDGTLVIEPAAVDIANEYKENQDENQESSKEINFDDFIKEIQKTIPDKNSNLAVAPRKSIQSFGPSPNTFSTTKCSACNIKINPFIGQSVYKHPLMEVVLCSECIQNQKDEFFVIDKEDDKETLCRWCVEGGSLICCDICPKSFCKTCIKRNLGRTKLSEILGQDDSVQWRCFVCNPKPIEALKEICLKVFEDVRLFQEKQRSQKLSKKAISKRPLSKGHLNEPNGGSPSPKISKVTTPSPLSAPTQPISTKSGALLSNMANYGTDWYMRNVKLRTIFAEIDEIDSRSLLNAINSTKKCVEAFYSDVRNLEVEISKATTAADIPAVVSMFKSVYRHHIFNRFCQVRARVEEDRRTKFVGGAVARDSSDITAASVVMDSIDSTIAAVIGKETTVEPVVKERHIARANSVARRRLTINNVVSSAPVVHHSDGHHSNHALMTSIDLTDDNDRPDSPDITPSIAVAHNNGHNSDNHPYGDGGNVTANIVFNPPWQQQQQQRDVHEPDNVNEVVDLCADDDSVSLPTTTAIDDCCN